METIHLVKNDDESLIIQEREYKSKMYVDFRIWYIAKNSSKEPLPTRKGFTLSYDKFLELKELLKESFKESDNKK